jgi:Skp family chaperone for outer membrane proteins
MKTGYKWLLAGVAMACGTLAILNELHAQPAASAPALGQTRVGVCDVVQIFSSYDRAKDMTDKLEKRRQAIQAENQTKAKDLDAINVELEGLKPGSDEYEKRFNDKARMTADLDSWQNLQKALLLRDHERLTREMYQEINDAIARVAKERDLQIVLFRDQAELVSADSGDIMRQIASRRVLYYDGRLDVTDAVLLRLNEAYRSAKH